VDHMRWRFDEALCPSRVHFVDKMSPRICWFGGRVGAELYPRFGGPWRRVCHRGGVDRGGLLLAVDGIYPVGGGDSGKCVARGPTRSARVACDGREALEGQKRVH
jgi:hypothetical protein